jgi:diaminopimelate epimerase
MSIEFHKMHGAGNDFVLIDARQQAFEVEAASAARIADRHLGIGCDQILVLREATRPGSLLSYEIWNSDGSPAGQCGNGARCVGLYIELNNEYPGEPFRVDSPAGMVSMRRCDDGEYELDMGVPGFEPGLIPLGLQPEGGMYSLESPLGLIEFGAVSMGNPHALVVVSDIDDPVIAQTGAWLGAHEAFPEGVNAGFAELVDPAAIRLRVVERGAGETLACGSGACAAVAILRRRELVEDRVEVFLPGGRLVIKWPGNNETLLMKGPAKHVFRGTMNE